MNSSTYFFLTLTICCNVWLYCDGKEFKILKCYQCESLSNHKNPLCDTEVWQTTAPSEKDQFVTVCPNTRSAFCMKLVVQLGKVVKTTRGCSGKVDSQGVQLSVGCSRSIAEGDEGNVCMCDRSLCNGALRAAGAPVSAASLLLALALLCR